MCVDYPIVNVPKRATYAKIEKILKECTTRSEFDDSALCKWINLKGVLSIFNGLIGNWRNGTMTICYSKVGSPELPFGSFDFEVSRDYFDIPIAHFVTILTDTRQESCPIQSMSLTTHVGTPYGRYATRETIMTHKLDVKSVRFALSTCNGDYTQLYKDLLVFVDEHVAFTRQYRASTLS